MSEIKVSNELLSWVFGCECEFDTIGKETGLLYYLKYIKSARKYYSKAINIHELINLAKIKACDKGYEVLQGSRRTKIYNIELGKKIKSFCYVGAEDFHISNVLFVLEWVVEKVGGEG